MALARNVPRASSRDLIECSRHGSIQLDPRLAAYRDAVVRLVPLALAQRSQRSRRPQPNKRDDAHPVTSGGRRLRHRTFGASRSQSSKQVFQRGEAGRGGAEDAEEGFWRFAQRPIERCARRQYCPSLWPLRLAFLLLRVEKLACLPWIGSRDPLSACLDGPTQRCAHLARHRAGRDLGRSAGESVRYRHPGGNSSCVAVIRGISSAEDAEIAEKAQKGRLWRFAQNAQRVPLVIVRPRPALAASSRRSADATKACDD